MRPAGSFLLAVTGQLVQICRDCRVKLWDSPDDPGEAGRR